MKRIDLSGRKVGLLTVGEWVKGSKGKSGYYLCSCDCGGTRKYTSGSLSRATRSKLLISCGCVSFSGDNSPVSKGCFQKTKASEYSSWAGIKQRCLNPENQDYPIYGGRGIEICDRWVDSFENFYEDMGPRPSGRYSLDRIDVDGNYEPSNCRWATDKQQARNRTNNRTATYKGETKCMSEWAEVSGISLQTIYSRMFALGWSIEKTLETPVKAYRKAVPTKAKRSRKPRMQRVLTFGGVTKPVVEWEKQTGIPKATILGRIERYGWPVEKALSTPVGAVRKQALPKEDISGQRFHKLVALSYIPGSKAKHSEWLCQCDCGRQTTARASYLRKGKRKSCGCFKRATKP